MGARQPLHWNRQVLTALPVLMIGMVWLEACGPASRGSTEHGKVVSTLHVTNDSIQASFDPENAPILTARISNGKEHAVAAVVLFLDITRRNTPRLIGEARAVVPARGEKTVAVSWRPVEGIHSIEVHVAERAARGDPPNQRSVCTRRIAFANGILVHEDIFDEQPAPSIGYNPDPRARGTWKVVDLVDKPELFTPTDGPWKSAIALDRLHSQEEGGHGVMTKMEHAKGPISEEYVIDFRDPWANDYTFRTIEGRDYLFVETTREFPLRNDRSQYYVLSRAGRQCWEYGDHPGRWIYEEAQRLYETGNHRQANLLFRLVHDKFPEWDYAGRAAIMVGLLHSQQGADSEARVCFEQVLREYGDVPRCAGEAWYRLGELDIRQGRRSEAMKAFEAAVEVLERGGYVETVAYQEAQDWLTELDD